MDHPLTRLFVPISFVLIIAASIGVRSVTGDDGFDFSESQFAEVAQNRTDVLNAAISVQSIPDLP